MCRHLGLIYLAWSGQNKLARKWGESHPTMWYCGQLVWSQNRWIQIDGVGLSSSVPDLLDSIDDDYVQCIRISADDHDDRCVKRQLLSDLAVPLWSSMSSCFIWISIPISTSIKQKVLNGLAWHILASWCISRFHLSNIFSVRQDICLWPVALDFGSCFRATAWSEWQKSGG